MKVLDTKEYVSILKELIEQGKEAGMVIAGNSMSPFLIHGRDSIFFRKPDKKIKKGDMVFYQRENGQYVMHRIRKVTSKGCFIVGDAQQEIEGPIEESQIFAVVVRAKRKGKLIGPGDFWWEFFEHIWINLVPFRRGILKIYSRLTRLR